MTLVLVAAELLEDALGGLAIEAGLAATAALGATAAPRDLAHERLVVFIPAVENLGLALENLVELTAVELDILVALLRRVGRVVPRGALLSEAGRGDVNVGERTIDVHISRLRKQLGDDPRAATRIQTIRGVGYMLTREGD